MLQTYNEENDAINGLFREQWILDPDEPMSGELSPISWPGIDFERPKDAEGRLLDYVALYIVNGKAEQIGYGSPGSNLRRHPGIIVVKIFGGHGLGTAESRALALGDRFCQIFKSSQILTGVVFAAPYIRKIGENPDKMYQVNGFCPFTRDNYS